MDKILVNKMIELAKLAQKHSYSPYSKYPVGASVVGLSGKIYTGTNIENASFGLSICAERVAIFKAISNGEKGIKDVCIVAKSASPCGACRQVIMEFAQKDSKIIFVDWQPTLKNNEKITIVDVKKLLYKPFNSEKAGL